MILYDMNSFNVIYCWCFRVKIAIFLNTDISQGSIATRLGCVGVFKHDCYKFPTDSNSERILKIG